MADALSSEDTDDQIVDLDAPLTGGESEGGSDEGEATAELEVVDPR